MKQLYAVAIIYFIGDKKGERQLYNDVVKASTSLGAIINGRKAIEEKAKADIIIERNLATLVTEDHLKSVKN